MKDRYYLRYDGSETEQRLSGAEDQELRAVRRIHTAMEKLDAARAALATAAEVVRREVRRVETPKRIKKDFAAFQAAGGSLASEYKDWFCGRSKRPNQPVRQFKHMRLVASQSPRSVRLPEKPEKPVIQRERLEPDDAA
jgi:hypothetical protein